MATDPALVAFLAIDDDAAATAHAETRAEALGLALPPETRAGVVENLALLRRQAEVFMADLDDAASNAPEAFEP